MPHTSPPAPIHFPRRKNRSFILPAAHAQGQHPATPTISPPPEYASRDGSLPTSDQDSIEAVTSSHASSCDEKRYTESDWDRRPDKEQVKEKSLTPEKRPKSKKSTRQTVEPEPSGIQIWLTILQLPRKTRWGWLLVALLIILICILFPILWIDAYHAGSQGATANSTSTVTVTFSEPTITSIITKTSSATVTTTLSQSTVLETHPTTSISSTPTPTPTRIGGFAAIEYKDDYGDSGVALYWVDDNGDIKELDSDSTATNGWVDGGTLTSNVRVGSAVSHTYPSYSTDDYLFFVGEDFVIQDLSGFWNWESGTLSALQLKTSESMNFMACAPGTTTTVGTNNLAEIYLFYNSTNGHVRIVELSGGQWLPSPDTPFSVSTGFVGCDSDYYGNLLAYVVNRDGQLEQWSLKKDLTEPWTLDLQYDGPYLPQTLIYSVTASENSQGRSHIFLQDIENMIVRLDSYGLGTNTTIVGKADITRAVSGTRMSASGDCNSTVTLYYQTNGTEMREYSMVDDAVNNAVFMIGNGPVESDLPFASGAGKFEAALGTSLALCLVAALCFSC